MKWQTIGASEARFNVRSGDDTEADHKAIQAVLSQIVYYPLSQFDGKMKTKDWSKLPHFPAPKATAKARHKWVNPETFFDELPAVMKQVPPMPGEEALYNWIGSVLEAAAKDPQIKQTLKETAVVAERELIDPFFQWRNNGRPAGNGWNSPVNRCGVGNRLPQSHGHRQVEHVRQPARGNQVHLHGR